MASLVLSVAGAAVGGMFGPAGAMAGRLVGALAGSMLDQAIFGNNAASKTGPRLADLDVMASTEGAPLPRLFGRARLSGQVIWATQLEEVVTTRSDSAGGKGGLGPKASTTTYSYFANVAIGLCEGPIGHVARIWADGQLLDTSNLIIRVHPGTETQEADDLIVAKEGADNAPAYRGLAYIVFERLPLADFGNRIPQMSFEIVRAVGALENKVRAVTLIPGTTEFGYEPSTVVQVTGPGQSAPENRHVANAPSDVIASLDELQAVCPNLERVAIVVAWFGDDLRAGHCKVRPGIDNLLKATNPLIWAVDGVTRAAAYQVSQIDGRAAFGGTPSDDSVTHLIAELKARGLKVTLYPFLMMDIPTSNALPDPWTGAATQPAYPWRGWITCDPAPGQPGTVDASAAAATQIDAFFSGSGPSDWSYRRMVLHYANLALAAGGVDAFLIGSELKSLTRVRSASGVYPAVTALVTLATDVKAILGASTVITYGADWTEYGSHVVDSAAQEVRFPLDPLWASSAIDAIGIDFYPPLADWRDDANQLDAAISTSTYNRDYLIGNVAAGEAYDWYYADDVDRAAQIRSPITDGLGKPWIYRPKDLASWWGNSHVERVGGAELPTPTAWVPESKPIWLTETGCPAVDKGANQPSVFPDAKSADGGLPYFSNGRRDDLIQRRYCGAMLDAFDPDYSEADAINPESGVYAGRMMDASAIHLWTWDARPYPVFPLAEDVWSDAPNWETGHWLNGRMGSAPLDELMTELLASCGITDADTSSLGEGPMGYAIDRPMTPRAMIEPLAQAYAFDGVAAPDALVFRARGGVSIAEFDEDDLVLDGNTAALRLVRAQETELPREVSFSFTDAGSDYRRAAVHSRRLVGGAARVLHSDFAIIGDSNAMSRRADIWLQDLWAGREAAEFALPPSALALMPGDVIGVTAGGRRRLFEIGEIVDTEQRKVKARSIDPDVFATPLPAPRRQAPAIPAAFGPVEAVALELPTLDASNPAVLMRLAVFANPWPSSVAVWRTTDGTSYSQASLVHVPAIIGTTLDPLPRGPAGRWDYATKLRVALYGGSLTSVTDTQLFDGANVAAIRNEAGAWEIVQFANAELVGEGTYELSRLLRGQAGSDFVMADLVAASAPFVMLDEHVTSLVTDPGDIDRTIGLRVVAASRATDDASAVTLTVTPGTTALKPLSPVHVKAWREADGVHFSWIRRARRDGDSWVGEVPLAEDSEAYEIDILDGSDVVRTLSVTQPSALYANADEIADFGAPQTALSLRVMQMSETIGRGFPAAATALL